MDLVTKLIVEESKSVRPQNIFLGGFSQGCCLSLATFLKLKDMQLGGVVGLSGMMALQIKDWDKELDLPLKRKTPMFLYHGESDPMIGCHDAAMSYDLFSKHKLSFEFHTERGLTHSLSMKEI